MEVLHEGLLTSVISLSIITTVICAFIYLYCCYKLNYWTRRGVQQLPNTSKIFGDFKNGILFRIAPAYYLGNIYREAPSDAPYVGFYIFHKACLLLKDPEIIKQILIRDFDNFSDRNFAGRRQKDSVGMINLFGLKNPGWRYLKKKITPAFTRDKLKKMLPFMIDTGKPMMNYFKENILGHNETKVIDAQDIYYKYTADLIANVALGTKTDCFKYPDSEYSKCLGKFFLSFKRMVALVILFFMPEIADMVGSLMLVDLSFARKLFWKAIESREKNKEERGDYIDSIIKYLKNGQQDPLYKFEGDGLWHQTGIFFSGLESSSAASAFTLMQLAKNKDCQDRVRDDIKNAIDKHGWTIEAFNDMKYLDQCITEGIRMHPPISTIDRYTSSDYKIPNTNIIIEKGTPIYISLYGLHGDPKFFDEPEVFNPERFNNDRIISDAYVPFGDGPKKCIGMKLGQLHMKVLLALTLLEYKVYQESAKVNKLDSRATFTVAADGINVEFTKLI